MECVTEIYKELYTFIGYLTESMARGYLSGALPFLYDDPSSDVVLKPLLMHSFGGVEMGTRRAQFSARCSPIVTCNEFVVDSLSKADERYIYYILPSLLKCTPHKQYGHTSIILNSQVFG